MSSKLKVLQVIPKLGFGGAETGCYDLAHYLSEQGCKSYIVTSGGDLVKFVRKEKVKVFKLPVHSKNPAVMLFNTMAISLIVLIFNIDIVHARSRAPAWSCLWSCLITRKKYVTTFHGTYNFSSSFKCFYNSIMVRSKLIIAGSNFIFDHINKNYQKFLKSNNKLLVIFRGINLDFYSKKNISEKSKNLLIKNWGLDNEKIVMLLPGRLTRWKGQEMFIEALNIIIEDYGKSNFQAIILGSDQGRSVYSKKLHGLVERYRLGARVKFISHCKEMPLAYSVSDIVVSSSIEPEAFGRVAVEAQAMEKPIIASDIGGSKETILNEKSGFLYKAADPRELAKVLNKVMELDKEALYLIGNEGRKNVTKKFDVDKMCHTTLTEYKKLLNK
ncbi:glycosyltransferase family 4 protein [Pelagibacteraceae bacterium]|jgi:glycosyltransferase involved in cell wall biosynthesis|nr:glycosyltransferase family 4 protein [Pelagibacteraceae bacterium]